MTDEKSQQEQRRELALKNIRADNLRNLAVAYFISKGKDFGEADNSVAETHLYFPAMNSSVEVAGSNGESTELIRDALLGSREDGERYSGSVSERSVLKTAGNIIIESVVDLTVGDVSGFINYTGDLEGINSDAYLSDLIEGDETDKRVARVLVGSYQTYLANQGLSSAYGQEAKNVGKNLERVLKGE